VPRQEPERTCIVTRETRSAEELMRFVLGPDGEVVADLRNRLPGRGAWVTPLKSAVALAAKRRLFTRAFKTEAKTSPDLAEEVEAALLRDLLGSLALANKAGSVIAGFGKVEGALISGEAVALIHAAEASADGRRKLVAALRKGRLGTISLFPILDDVSGDDLDMALGRSHVIHAALLAGPGGQGCLARWRRLRAYRGVGDAAESPGNVDGQQGKARGTELQD
jgi:predicted RNA-binding protein YlxR (DUF448 family)